MTSTTKQSNDEQLTGMERLRALAKELGSKEVKMEGAIVWFPDLSRPAKETTEDSNNQD